MTKDLLARSIRDLMEGAPKHLNLPKIRERLKKIPGVRAVKELHVWSISNNKVLMTAHFEVDSGVDRDSVHAEMDRLAWRMGITHHTIACRAAAEPPSVVPP